MNKFQRTILSFTPLPFLLRKSKRWFLPGFQGLALFDVIQFFRKQLKEYGLSERAAAVSYNFIMAIPPSLLFLFTLIPNLPFVSKKIIKLQLHAVISDVIPNAVYNKQVIAFVDTFINGTKIGLLSFGLLTSFYFASNGIMGLMRSFNKKNVGFLRRKKIVTRLIALRLTTVIFALLAAYISLLILQGTVLKMMVSSSTVRDIIEYTRWIFIVLLVYCIIGCIFKYAPAIKEKWAFTSPGTILATTLSLAASFAFSMFVKNFGK